MKFISIFLERPRILFLTLAFILLTGISSIFTLPIQENPELAQRWASVTIEYPGATPERIETQVINDLEAKLREIVEIDELESIITQGFSNTTVELEQSVPPRLIEETWSRVQGKIDQVTVPEESEILLSIVFHRAISAALKHVFLSYSSSFQPKISQVHIVHLLTFQKKIFPH